ncbi:MAG: hypothetical protein WBO06_00065 [Gammaproteobacteria bacterium]|jgi:SMC interacting uncharacterized protein involved in chromosome segregation
MNDVRERIDAIVEELKTERDELRVKLSLAKLETSDEWEKLEAKLVKLEAKAREVGSATAAASQDVGAAAKLLGEEIRDGFRKIASHF